MRRWRGVVGLSFTTLVFAWLVAAANAAESFHFAHEISPILAKVGCAAAECHGTATGQGGFKLSLFAGDPRDDFEAIRNELDGRRVDFLNPGISQLLR